MLEQIGGFIGMMAADVVHFFRGRQAIPCTVDWDQEPYWPGGPIVYENRQAFQHAVLNDPTFAWADDDCCPDYETDCCLATDTVGEYEGKV